MEQKSMKNGFVEFGMGVVSYVAADAIVTAVKKLEKEGKLNRKEGERFMKEVVEKYQTASRNYGKTMQSQIDSMMDEQIKSSPFATKKQVQDLNARLDRLAASSKKAPAKKSGAAKKAARRKLERGITRGLKPI